MEYSRCFILVLGDPYEGSIRVLSERFTSALLSNDSEDYINMESKYREKVNIKGVNIFF